MKGLMPREKILESGVETLENYELLAVLIGSATKKEGVLDLSKRILNEINGLDDLINMSIEDWMLIRGIATAKAAKLVAFLELAKRIYTYDKKVISLRKSEEVFNYIKYDVYGKTHEQLIVLYVNVKCNLVKKVVSSKGKVNILYVDVKQIVNDAIKCSSSGVFLIHNHPSGDVTPSESDIDLTDHIKKALSFFDIQLLDHLIIGNNKFYSFQSNNLL